jgi:shikimate kinase
MNVFLIGLPGSGKSTLGKQVAQMLSLRMVDTDEEIVKAEGKSIEAIFAEKGEAAFRLLEQQTLHKVAASDGQLISTGGGMPCFFDNIEHMNKKGISIFIDVPLEALAQRLSLQHNRNSRPMLAGKSDEEILAFLKQKYAEREPYYAQATYRLQGTNIQPGDLLNILNTLV